MRFDFDGSTLRLDGVPLPLSRHIVLNLICRVAWALKHLRSSLGGARHG